MGSRRGKASPETARASASSTRALAWRCASSSLVSDQPKRLIVHKDVNGVRTAGVLLRDGATKGNNPSVQVVEVRPRRQRQRQDTDFLPYLPRFRRRFISLPQSEEDLQLKARMVPIADVEALTISHLSINVNGVLKKDEEAMREALRLAAQVL